MLIGGSIQNISLQLISLGTSMNLIGSANYIKWVQSMLRTMAYNEVKREWKKIVTVFAGNSKNIVHST